MNRPTGRILLVLAALSMINVSARAIFADEPSMRPAKPSPVPPGLVLLIEDVINTVLEHHIDPPARQQMILTGVKALYKATHRPVPEGLSRRVSNETKPEQVAELLAASWPTSTDKTVTQEELKVELLNGLLFGVSGGAELMPEKERKVQEQSEGNRYVGVHISLRWDGPEKHARINDVIEGGPADLAGLKPNDLIEQVEGVDTKGVSLRDVVDRLRGDEGTSVTIKVRRAGDAAPLTFTMVRGQHPRQSIKGWRKQASGDWNFHLNDSKQIAYLQISDMMGSTPHELRKVAKQLESDGVKAVVLDLRGAWSNSAHTAVLLADALLEGGTIGRVRTNRGETTYQADADVLFRGCPMVVLVDGNTSPASEWLAAALDDNGRATVIGDPTAGGPSYPRDAVVSSTFPVGGGEWSLSIATGILERSNGKPLSVVDRSVRMRRKSSESARKSPDPTEKKALEFIELALQKTQKTVPAN